MHPHWHSASPAVQRKIISLFVSSLTLPGSETTPSTQLFSPAFASELADSSPHDVAAVFRWALRHLELEGGFFGKEDASILSWYSKFSSLEKEKSYPQKAYSELLPPLVKPSHVELLSVVLELFASLTSHSEMNGVSGSKLTMALGQYVLGGNRVIGLEDWPSFYGQWERVGLALEHVFLASLRCVYPQSSLKNLPRSYVRVICIPYNL